MKFNQSEYFLNVRVMPSTRCQIWFSSCVYIIGLPIIIPIWLPIFPVSTIDDDDDDDSDSDSDSDDYDRPMPSDKSIVLHFIKIVYTSHPNLFIRTSILFLFLTRLNETFNEYTD